MGAPPTIQPLPAELARELVRQGEARLEALTDIGGGADMRATTLCGIFGAVAVGLGGTTLAQLSTPHPNMQLVCAGGITATFLLIASAASAFAAAPTDCWLGGGSPDLLRLWLWDQGKWHYA